MSAVAKQTLVDWKAPIEGDGLEINDPILQKRGLSLFRTFA